MRTASVLFAAHLLLAGCAATRDRGQEANAMARLDYVELPATDISATRTFYERAFGWTMTQFAPTYAATTTGDTDVGLQSDAAERPQAPLAVIQVPDLEAALAAVQSAGGEIVKPIQSFPGGRRFHFRDPSGNELAVWQAAE
jgi:predicted enzyme related to lactoylglutathione lyase